MYGVRNGHKEASLVCTTVVENLHIYIEKLKLEKSTSYLHPLAWIFSTDFFLGLFPRIFCIILRLWVPISIQPTKS